MFASRSKPLPQRPAPPEPTTPTQAPLGELARALNDHLGALSTEFSEPATAPTRATQAAASARTLAVHMTGLAAELDDPTTAPERRRKLIALVERIQTTFKGHSQPDTEIRVALLESIRWTVEELPRLKAAFEARSPDRRVLVEPFVAALCEAPPERVALGRFESSYPALRTQLEGQLSALRDGIASWRGKRGPAKGNLPRGPGKWDVLNKLMIACRFATETSTASGLEKEWERRPQNPKSGQRPHAMWEDMARLYDLNPLAKIIPNPYREFARELAEHVQRRRNGVGS